MVQQVQILQKLPVFPETQASQKVLFRPERQKVR